MFKKVAGARKYFKYSECEPGQKLVSEGYYKGPEEGKFGVQHVFTQKDGQIVVLNSSGHLNWLLENHVELGKLCNVYYAEKVLLTRGSFKGKEAHNFELEVDDGDGVEVKHTAPRDLQAEAALAQVSDTDDISL